MLQQYTTTISVETDCCDIRLLMGAIPIDSIEQFINPYYKENENDQQKDVHH